MSQQGERRTHAEDDWWDRLYDEATPGTDPTTGTGHTVDDHFDSTQGMISDRRPDGTPDPPLPAAPPVPSAPPPEPTRGDPELTGLPERGGPFEAPRTRAPWEPLELVDPPATPARPATPRTPGTLGPDPRASASGWEEPWEDESQEEGQESTGAWDAWLPTPRRRTGAESAGPGRDSRGADAEAESEAVAESAADVSTFPFTRVDDAPSASSTWGPPPSPPGPPGAPGPRPDRHRTRRLWDEPGPHGTPSPDPDPDATTVTSPALGATAGRPPAPEADTGADGGPAAPTEPAPGARRTETRAEGHLRDIPPLPTSFPRWYGGQDRDEDRDRGQDPGRDRNRGQDPGTAAEWEAPPVPPAAPLVPPAAPPPPATSEPALAPAPRPVLAHVGDGPPTYDAEPTALAAADPQDLDGLVADTVLDGAQYGSYTLRAASVRGDSARYRGEPRRDTLLTARFGNGPGGLVLVAVASGARAAEGAHLAAADACRWIAGSVGRSHARLAEDIRVGRRGDLKSGLHRLTDRSYGKLRAHAAERGLEPGEYTADLRCLLLSADPDCRTRIYFGVGDGGLFRLRDGVWQDIEPPAPRPDALAGEPVVGFGSVPAEEEMSEEDPDGDRLTMDLGITTPPSPHVDSVPPTSPFRFRASVARPGDVLLLSSAGLAEPVRGEPALARELAERWAGQQSPPGLATFLADVTLRAKGYADDRTAVAVWEA
ncbi:protein phosphatase 2C domain-containing protein [Streptomyces sp. NPDC048442]|uniref:protein phosphatase 2C domain-containing protein n=1 Tax=Streptomyces sp. NPDC048442 TaxID=3154823 RepID=UPI003427E112